MEKKFCVFLGGIDREMEEIKEVAYDQLCTIYNGNLSWGAKLSDYAGVIDLGELAEFENIILVELEIDTDILRGLRDKVTVIDHHGEEAGKAPALIQFLDLFGITPTREQLLIGAMDAAWVPGLIALGASMEEIAQFLGVIPAPIKDMLIAAADRGVTEEEAEQAALAVINREIIGDLIVVRCPHSKCGPITARTRHMQEKQNLLVISADNELNYFGSGINVRAIMDIISGGWSGGAGLAAPTAEATKFWSTSGGNIPDTAFWGCSGTAWDSAVIDLVKY